MPAIELSFRLWEPVGSSSPQFGSQDNRSRRLMGFVVCGALVFFWLGCLEGQQLHRSLVKVYLQHESPGVLHGDHYLPEIRVQEVIELQGVVISPGTHVVSYVGGHWRTLSDTRSESNVQVQTQAGEKREAELVGVDQRYSLALLRSQNLNVKPIEFEDGWEESDLRIGSLLGRNCRLSAPAVVESTLDELGPFRRLQLVVTPGLVQPCLVEGGVVASREGGLMGIIERWQLHPFSASMRVSTILPADVVRDSVEAILEEKGDIEAGWLGIGLERRDNGLRVATVLPGSPAKQAGFREGDLIVAIASHPIQHRQQVLRAVRTRGAGQPLNLTVQRGDEQLELTALLTERQDRNPKVSWRIKMPGRWRSDRSSDDQIMVERTLLPAHFRLGVLVEGRLEESAEMGEPASGRLVVIGVVPDSPAGREGFEVGDILLEVNGERVTSAAELKLRLESMPDPIMILLSRQGRYLTKTVSLR